MSSQGISGNSVYKNLLIAPSNNVAKSDNTRVVKQIIQQPILQNYNSSANYSKSGSANTSINFAEQASKVVQNSTTSGRTAQQIISSLTAHKNEPAKFASEVNKILQNNNERSTLIKHFGLDSATNKKNLGIAMFLEAGEGLNKQHMMPVGAVILNRALSNNLALAASGKTQVINVSDIIKEKGQFAIRSSFNSALSGGRKDAVNHGTSSEVQSMVNDLANGQVGNNSSAENAFFFQRATLRHQSFRAGSHSFSQTPSSVQYVNGNYLVGTASKGYYKK